MDIEQLERALNNLLPNGFTIETNDDGRLVILTNLLQDEEGELEDLISEDDLDEEELADTLCDLLEGH